MDIKKIVSIFSAAETTAPTAASTTTTTTVKQTTASSAGSPKTGSTSAALPLTVIGLAVGTAFVLRKRSR